MNNTINIEKDYDFTDVINYWMSLFPEINDINEFENIVKEVKQSSLQDLEQEWAKQEYDSHKDNIEILELFNFNSDEKTKKIEAIFNKNEKDYEKLQFFNFFRPIIKYYLYKYYDVINNYELLKNNEIFLQSLIAKIAELLYQISYRTLVLEVNIAKSNDLLIGESSEERFLYFQNSLLKDESFLKDLYTEYGCLISLMKLNTKNYLDFIIEILERTSAEINQISTVFNGGKALGNLLNIETGSGDTHQGGKSVSILYFATGVKLIYKPRELNFEEGYYNLINWINEQNVPGMKKLKAAKSLSVNGSGWMEFIPFEECTDEDHVNNFYYRIGHLLCLLHALNARDFHSENLIANSEHPVLVDLESLIHGSLEKEDNSIAGAMENCAKLIESSVISILLLPSRIVLNDKCNVNVFDLGGVGGSKEQLSPFKSEVIQHNNTDNIKVTRDYVTLEPNNNNPKIKNHNQQIEQFLNQIQEGFKQTYDWILDNKEKFINKILELFSNQTCRILFKHTFIYGRLLRSSYHPDLLRSPIHREILLHRIALYKFKENFEKISPYELKDLLIGDIPYFTTNTSLKTVKDSRGQIVNGYNLKVTPLETSIKKIREFSTKDLKNQLKFIDLSFIHTENKNDSALTNVTFSKGNHLPQNNSIEDQNSSLLKIGNHLLENSIMGKTDSEIDRTWIGLMMSGKDEITTRIASVDFDLYKGNSGISLFLGYLSIATRNEEFKKAAIESLTPCIKLLNSIIERKKNNAEENEIYSIGAFSGLSGIFYTLFHLGKSLNIEKFIDFTYENIGYLLEDVKKGQDYDLIGGSAGYLGVVLSIYNKTTDKNKKEMLLKIANEIYLDLENNATYYSNDSVFWGPNLETEGYTGFAHGTSGISAMLIRLHKITKNPNILKLIEKTLNYERSMFSSKDANWYTNLSRVGISVGWCHGAPGILLNRLILKDNGYYDDMINHEIQVALDTTIQKGFGNNSTWCHGDTGNLEILQYAAKVLNDSYLENNCLATYHEIFRNSINSNWDKGYSGTVNIYGLLVGLAGNGYSILKHRADLSIPGILWLE
ncbi:type 2 lanthipeptide synthetase LanM family protein [Bacillus thuringiensis]|uniref:type 2 lanthipeptide synthetase LanM family protein n=1 Tax=Bacillus thuringiensis TaxID=1428 RepID=UPI002FBEF859